MAIPLIQNSTGSRFVIGISGFDMSANTDLQFHFVKPDCFTNLFVNGILGTTTETINGDEFVANEWAYYIFEDDDLDQASDDQNKYRADLKYVGPTEFVAAADQFSTITSFDVTAALVSGTP